MGFRPCPARYHAASLAPELIKGIEGTHNPG